MQIKDDLAKLEKKLGKMSKSLVKKATPPAVNKTLRSVNAYSVKEISAETSIKQKDIRKDHKLSLSRKKDLSGVINARESRARNLASFVRPSQRKVNHFNARNSRGKYKKEGVRAKAWGKTKTYKHTFIGKSPQGNLLVFARKGPERAPLKSIKGPSPREVFNSRRLRRGMKRKAKARLSIEMDRSFRNHLRKLK
ncbi:phage tail protein (plasmid) [Microbulbifer sp. TRSA001]|uniref:phage tail protein n=1 Tax=Microbulbifer sp. TRSA001 TaxID=3243381 RepID=UPI00403A544D